MITILLTGFGRWDDLVYNPSGVVASRLDGEVLSGKDYGTPLEGKVFGKVLDVAWESGATLDGGHVESAALALARYVAVLKPQILLSLGVAPNDAYGYDVEYVAEDASHHKDVRGLEPPATRLDPTWPEKLALPLPQRPIIDAMTKANLDVRSNPGLGQFLCERVAYEGARLARTKGTSLLRAGFIHVCNPMARAMGQAGGEKHPWAYVPKEIPAGDRPSFDAAEREVCEAIRIALRVTLGSLPADAETRPAPWKYLDSWLPEYMKPVP